jgi:hypothetical protein
MIRSAAAALATLLAGCFLPVATGTPQPASTVGTGKFGAGVAWEAPTLELTAGTTDFNDSYAESPVAAGRIGIAYGLAAHTDVEASLELSLYYYILPMPVGGTIGIRQQLVAREHLDLSVAARVGALRVGGEDSEGREDSAKAELGQLSISAQGAFGAVRPLISIAGMGARMTRNVLGVAEDFNGFAGSATLGLMFQLGSLQVGPYVTGTYFTSDEFSGAPLVSGGLSLESRSDPHAR